MPSGDELQVVVAAGREITEVAARLREVDKRLPTRFRAAMRKAAAAGIRRAKTEARAMPSGGKTGGTSAHPHKAKQLRRAVARGVRARASTGGRYGAGMRIITAMPLPKQAILPRGLDTPTGWEHPVFGKADQRVIQPGGSWVRAAVAEEQPAMEKDLLAAIAHARDWIAAAGTTEGT